MDYVERGSPPNDASTGRGGVQAPGRAISCWTNGYGSLIVTNLFAIRTSDHAGLCEAVERIGFGRA